MKRGRVLAAVAAAILLLATPTDLTSCGPFVPQAVFVTRHGPVDPNVGFTAGKLGVVQPGFQPSYLVVSYRYLSGLGLKPNDAKALFPAQREPVPLKQMKPEEMPPLYRWIATRNRYATSPVYGIDPYKNITRNGEYTFFQNCLDDAFGTAAKTLQARVSTWGAGSDALKDWIAGQDAVFSNCSAKGGQTPAPAPGNSPPLLQEDRTYQNAAAAFYTGDWNAARNGFAQITMDKNSPWSRYAQYLIARTFIREGTVDKNPEALNKARAQLISIGNSSASRLVEYIDTRLAPERKMQQLSDALTKPQLGPDAGQEMTDFLSLYWNPNRETVKNLTVKSDLVDWLSVWKAGQGKSGDPFARWRASPTLPWLVAALYKAGGQEPEVPELLRAAHAVAPASPGYPSIAYYAATLSLKRGDPDAARAWDDEALQKRIEVADRNLFLAQRFALARTWDEFLKYSPREVKFYSLMGDDVEEVQPGNDQLKYANRGPAFDSDSANAWNFQIPLSLWIDAAQGTALPANLRAQLARAGWVRALVLDRPADAKILFALWQQLDPAGAAVAASYKSAPDDETARLAAALILLRNPGFSSVIRTGFGRLTRAEERDQLRDNWWCSTPLVPASAPLPFLTEADRAEGAKESTFVNDASRSGANYVTAEAIRFANARPNDLAAPEALGRAVEATHFTFCSNPATGPLSHQAFDILKQRYPNTTWAQETKYWYK